MPPMPTKWIGPMSRGSFMADRSPGFANARALWRGYGSGAQLVARMERSVMRERPIPDFAALHPGYAVYAAVPSVGTLEVYCPHDKAP
jgi:hypothetical protein